MNADEIRRKGKKIVSFEHRPSSGKSKELLGFYHVPDPNSPLNKLIRFMGKTFNSEKKAGPKKYSKKRG